jgi:hypothetical protein
MARAKPRSARVAAAAPKRAYLKQSDVPAASLDEALRLPQAVLDHYAGRPPAPLQVAKALSVDPKGSQIRVFIGSGHRVRLGGGRRSGDSDLGDRPGSTDPQAQGRERRSCREARSSAKAPRFGDFLRRYDGHAFPRKDIALNVLEELGVPREKTEEVLERIDASARTVGVTEEIKGKSYVTLEGVAGAATRSDTEGDADADEVSTQAPTHDLRGTTVPPPVVQPKGATLTAAIADDQRRRRVFITHRKNRDLVDPIRKLLEYGELEPVVSVERQPVSTPVPEKVMDDPDAGSGRSTCSPSSGKSRRARTAR